MQIEEIYELKYQKEKLYKVYKEEEKLSFQLFSFQNFPLLKEKAVQDFLHMHTFSEEEIKGAVERVGRTILSETSTLSSTNNLSFFNHQLFVYGVRERKFHKIALDAHRHSKASLEHQIFNLYFSHTFISQNMQLFQTFVMVDAPLSAIVKEIGSLTLLNEWRTSVYYHTKNRESLLFKMEQIYQMYLQEKERWCSLFMNDLIFRNIP